MVNVDDIYGSGDGVKYLTAKLCNDLGLWNQALEITEWELKEFDKVADDGRQYVEQKIGLHFAPAEASDGTEVNVMLVLNLTNKDIMKEAYGIETDEWVGQTVKIVKVKRKYQGRLVDAMQVVPEEGGEVEAPPSSSKKKETTPKPKIDPNNPLDEPERIEDVPGEWIKRIAAGIPNATPKKIGVEAYELFKNGHAEDDMGYLTEPMVKEILARLKEIEKKQK